MINYIFSSCDKTAKLCEYFSFFSTHVIVFARVFADSQFVGIHPFVFQYRDIITNEIKTNVELKWLGKTIGDRFKRQFVLKFNKLHLPFDSLVTKNILIFVAFKIAFHRFS